MPVSRHRRPSRVLQKGPEEQSDQVSEDGNDVNMESQPFNPPNRLPEDVSSATTVTPSLSESDMIPGVVTTELGDFPINSKFAGTSSPQVLAKTAEELFKMQAPQMNVMGFFCPLMTFGEEFPLPTAITRPISGKAVADACVKSEWLSPPFLSHHHFYLNMNFADKSSLAFAFL